MAQSLVVLLVVALSPARPIGNAVAGEPSYDEELGAYVVSIMQQVNAPLSDVRKQILARAIVRVTTEVFTEDLHRKSFVAIIGIESRFVKYAQSPTGPRGLTQVARAAFREGLGYCGMTEVRDEDVWEPEINLYAGACYYRHLLERYQDVYKAAVAYNQGPNSQDAKTYAKSGELSTQEALKYVAKFSYLKGR